MDVGSIEESKYIPEWCGNKEDPEPIEMILQPLAGGQQRRCMEVTIVDGETVVTPNWEQYCLFGIKSIEGMTQKGRPIATARDLIMCKARRIDELILEVGMEIMMRNRTPDLGNSEKPSAG